MALNSLFCADVPLSNYSLTHSLAERSTHLDPVAVNFHCCGRIHVVIKVGKECVLNLLTSSTMPKSRS